MRGEVFTGINRDIRDAENNLSGDGSKCGRTGKVYGQGSSRRVRAAKRWVTASTDYLSSLPPRAVGRR